MAATAAVPSTNPTPPQLDQLEDHLQVPLAPAATRDTGSALVTSEPDETPSSMSLDVSMTNSTTTTTHQSTFLNNTDKPDNIVDNIMSHDQVVANKYANFCNSFDVQF